jgi:hypothetical protein
VDPKPYKSDPFYNCNISSENESILERFRCLFQFFRYIYSLRVLTDELNDIRKQLNVKTGSIIIRSLKASLVLVDTFFGFEVIINK